MDSNFLCCPHEAADGQCKLVQHEANVARQRAVVDLVCAVIKGLERLRVKQAYKEIVG